MSRLLTPLISIPTATELPIPLHCNCPPKLCTGCAPFPRPARTRSTPARHSWTAGLKASMGVAGKAGIRQGITTNAGGGRGQGLGQGSDCWNQLTEDSCAPEVGTSQDPHPRLSERSLAM